MNSHLKLLGWRVFWLRVLCNSIIVVQGVLDPVSGMAHRAAKPQWDAEGVDTVKLHNHVTLDSPCPNIQVIL